MSGGRLSLAFGVLIGVFSLTAIAGHSLLLLVFWKNPMKRFRTPAMLIVASFAFTNLLSSLTTAPLESIVQIGSYLEGGYRPEISDSKIWEAATLSFYVFLNASYLIMMGLNLNQYLAIRFPHRYQTLVTRKVVAFLISLCWLISVASPLIPASHLPVEAVSRSQLRIVFESTSLLLCVVFVTLNVAFLRHRRRISPTTVPTARVAGRRNSVCVRTRGVRDRQITNANLFLFLFTITLSIVVSVLWHLSYVWKTNHRDWHNIAQMSAIFAFHLKISLDPFILVWRLTAFQKGIKRVLKFEGWYQPLLYRYACFTGKYTVHNSHESTSGTKWHIFHILRGWMTSLPAIALVKVSSKCCLYTKGKITRQLEKI